MNFFRRMRSNYRAQPLKWLHLFFRPAQNIDVTTLTSSNNANQIKDFNKIKPGDMIRTRKGKHILLVIQVETTKSGNLKKFRYAHSTEFYGRQNGVRQGEVEIINNKDILKNQKWKEIDVSPESPRNKNWTHEGFLDDDGRNGFYRLKLLEKK